MLLASDVALVGLVLLVMTWH